MNVARASPLDDVPDKLDGVAALVAGVILGWGFLYAIKPILGTTVALAVLSIYLVGRTADFVHISVVVVSWVPVFIGLYSSGLLGGLTGGVLGLLIYDIWLRTNAS